VSRPHAALIPAFALLLQSPLFWDWASKGFPTYGKWLYGSIWCVLILLLDGLAVIVSLVVPRLTLRWFVVILVGLALSCAAALPVAVLLAGFMHALFGSS